MKSEAKTILQIMASQLEHLLLFFKRIFLSKRPVTTPDFAQYLYFAK